MIKRNVFIAIAAAALAIVPSAFGQAGSNCTVGVTVGPEATFTTVDATSTLTKANTTFGGFGATTNFTYKIRTSQSTGTGSITVLVTAFATGGPAIADLAYTCTSPTSGTACGSSTPASISTASSVVAFGADVHSADGGDSGTAVWTLADRTITKTGAYTSTATFTISAT
jgi:hypothetical protein